MEKTPTRDKNTGHLLLTLFRRKKIIRKFEVLKFSQREKKSDSIYLPTIRFDSHSILCPIRRLLLSTFRLDFPFDIMSSRRFVPFDVFSFDLCPIRRFVRGHFFTVGIFYFDLLSVNHNKPSLNRSSIERQHAVLIGKLLTY